jgi:hypothetical protein
MSKAQEVSWMEIFTIQSTRSTVMLKAQPKTQSKILNTEQPLESTKVNIICGAVWKIDGIVEL